MDRWWNNYSGSGVGLRGGTFSYTGNDVVKLRLKRYRLLQGLAVSGLATWDRDRAGCASTCRSAARCSGRLRGGWDTRAVGAQAVLRGRRRRPPGAPDLPRAVVTPLVEQASASPRSGSRPRRSLLTLSRAGSELDPSKGLAHRVLMSEALDWSTHGHPA